jgi:Tol biopolymer transport system component
VAVSRDGRSLVFVLSENGRFRRQILSLAGGDPRDLGAGSRFSQGHPEVSPDGRWTSFDTDESGNLEVFVEPLTGGPKKQVSVGGGDSATWRADGKELFYVARDGTLMSVPIRESGAGSFETGDPQPLFPLQAATDPGFAYFRRPFDVAPDGERFLVVRRAADDVPEDAAVVLNWTGVLGPKANP